jgi:hypothetical protein
MQRKSIPKHSRRWCRAKWAIRTREEQYSDLKQINKNRLHIVDAAGIRVEKHVAHVRSTHLEHLGNADEVSQCVIWSWWAPSWVDSVLNITGQRSGFFTDDVGSGWIAGDRVKALLAVQQDPELMELAMSAQRLGGRRAAREILKVVRK